VLLSHPPASAAASSSGNKDDDLWTMSLASQKVDRVETAQQVSGKTVVIYSYTVIQSILVIFRVV